MRAIIEKKIHSKPVAQASRVREGINENEGDEERTGIYIKNKVYTVTPCFFISGACGGQR